jgi:hypothetical protein
MQTCDTIIYRKGIVAVVKILSITDRYVVYKPCDDNTNKSYKVKRVFINDIKSKEFPKASASYQASLYKKKAKKALRTVIGLLGVIRLLLFLFSRLDFYSNSARILILFIAICFLFLYASIILFIYLLLKAISRNQRAKATQPPK